MSVQHHIGERSIKKILGPKTHKSHKKHTKKGDWARHGHNNTTNKSSN